MRDHVQNLWPKNGIALLSPILFSLLLFAPASLKGQASESDVFDKSSKALWMGLDLSHFKIRGTDVEPGELREHMIEWNTLLIKEQEKYDPSKYFVKDCVTTNIDPALKTIEKIEPKDRIAEGLTEKHRLEEGTVEEIAKGYAQKDAEQSLGIVFVMEEFNKVKEHGTMWACFIDLSSGKLLKKYHFQTEPGGFGRTNYWARTYYNAMTECKKKLEKGG